MRFIAPSRRASTKGGGYVVAFGECVYRALDAVINAQEAGTKVGLKTPR